MGEYWRGDLVKVQLTLPACTEVGKEVTLLRRVENRWWLVGKCFCRLSTLIRYLLDVIGANLHIYHLTRKRTECITDDHGYTQKRKEVIRNDKGDL